MPQINFNHFLDPVSRQSWCLTLIARHTVYKDNLLFIYLSWHCPCFESISGTSCCNLLKSRGVRSFHRPSTAVLDIFGNNHSMRRFIPWLFNLDADLQNSHSVVAGLLWSTNFLAAPLQPHFNRARKRNFQAALRALFVSGHRGQRKGLRDHNEQPRSQSLIRASVSIWFWNGSCPLSKFGGGGESASIRDEPLFSRGGGSLLGKKLSAWDMKKIKKKIFCPRGRSGINCLQRPPDMLCKIWGILKQLSAQPEWKKKTCKCSIDGGKTFLPPRNHDTPPRKIMVHP